MINGNTENNHNEEQMSPRTSIKKSGWKMQVTTITWCLISSVTTIQLPSSAKVPCTGQDHKEECQLKVNQKIFSADQADYRPGWLTGSYIRTH